jgi:hypothetical protein
MGATTAAAVDHCPALNAASAAAAIILNSLYQNRASVLAPALLILARTFAHDPQ